MKYVSGTNEEKIICNNILKDYIANITNYNKIQLVALTLPSVYFNIEEYLYNNVNNSLINCYEKDYRVFQEQVLTVKILKTNKKINSQIKLNYDDILNAYKLGIQFNLIWFDFCSYFTESLDRSLKHFFSSNVLKNKGVVAFTFLRHRHSMDSPFYQSITIKYGYKEIDITNFYSVVLPQYLKDTYLKGYTSAVRVSYCYKASHVSRGSKMIFIVLSWGF